MAGYTRQSLAQILNGEIVSAPPLNAEFNQILAAFNNSTGHKHDGTAAEGPPIDRIADSDQNNLIFVDTSANQINFYVESSAASVGQISIQDGAIVPFTDNDIDLGSSSFEFKDLYIDGTANIDTLAASLIVVEAGTASAASITTTGDTDNGLYFNAANQMSYTSGGVAQVTFKDGSIVPVTDNDIDLGAVGAEFKDLYIDGTANIDSLVADTADINAGTIDNTVIGATTPAAGTFTNLTVSTGSTIDFTGATVSNGGTFTTVNISGGSITGITDLAIADGGTGASTASVARTNLGLAIGTNVQAYDAGLQSISGLTTTADQMIYTTSSDTYATASLTSAGRALLDDADASAQRTTLGLGTLATQNANSVAITGGAIAGVTINASVIGGTTPAAATFTNLTVSTGSTINFSGATVSNGGTFTTVTISGGSITGITDLAIADGGTGASTASAARTNLGVAIGTNVQAYDAGLQSISGLTTTADQMIYTTSSDTYATISLTSAGRALLDDASASAQRTTLGLVIGTDVQAYDADLAAIAALDNSDGNFIVGSATGWVVESGATVRASLGLGSLAEQSAVDNADWSGADLAVENGGTGASTASAARAALGLAIGTDVQAYDATLASLAALGTAADKFAYTTGVDTWAEAAVTAAGLALLDDADAATQVATLGFTFPILSRKAPGEIGEDTPAAITGTTITASTEFRGTVLTSNAASAVAIKTSGGTQFNVTHTASAVNYMQASGNSTGNAPLLFLAGSDTNVSASYSTKGTGGHFFYTGGNVNFAIANAASAVNYWNFTGAPTTGAPLLFLAGSDTNVSASYSTKGTGGHFFYTGGNVNFAIANAASAVNYLQATGAATGNGIGISSQGSDTNIPAELFTKGSGTIAFRTNANTNTQFAVVHRASAVDFVTAFGAAAGNSPGLTAELGSSANAQFAYVAKGSGSHIFITGWPLNVVQLNIAHTASSVNYWNFTGAPTTGQPYLQLAGSDTNISALFSTKGSGNFSFRTASLGGEQFSISHTASAVEYLQATGATSGGNPILSVQGASADLNLQLDPKGAGNVISNRGSRFHVSTAIPAGGTAGAGYMFSSTAYFGMFFGSGAPTLSAAKGSLYLRSDGSTTNDRAYINTDGSTTWTALTTAA